MSRTVLARADNPGPCKLQRHEKQRKPINDKKRDKVLKRCKKENKRGKGSSLT